MGDEPASDYACHRIDEFMQFRLSVAAENRMFSKAMRRIRPRFQPLTDAFEAVEVEQPIYEAILVGVTDSRSPDFCQEIENGDGYFQMLFGCSLRDWDQELAEDVFDILLRATRLCPFANSDREVFDSLFERMRPIVLG